jgi:hypothetical protein
VTANTIISPFSKAHSQRAVNDTSFMSSVTDVDDARVWSGVVNSYLEMLIDSSKGSASDRPAAENFNVSPNMGWREARGSTYSLAPTPPSRPGLGASTAMSGAGSNMTAHAEGFTNYRQPAHDSDLSPTFSGNFRKTRPLSAPKPRSSASQSRLPAGDFSTSESNSWVLGSKGSVVFAGRDTPDIAVSSPFEPGSPAKLAAAPTLSSIGDGLLKIAPNGHSASRTKIASCVS